MSEYENIRVRENPYSDIFYTVKPSTISILNQNLYKKQVF